MGVSVLVGGEWACTACDEMFVVVVVVPLRSLCSGNTMECFDCCLVSCVVG